MKKPALILSMLFLAVFKPTASETDANIYKVRVLIQNEIQALKQAEFTPQNLYRYILHSGLDSPEIVFKQAILETGNFRSGNFKRNNLFGMHYPTVRKTTAEGWVWGDTGHKSKVATYKHWTESVEDYKLWVQMHSNKDKSDYLKFLEVAGYCELNGGYTELLNQINIEKWIY